MVFSCNVCAENPPSRTKDVTPAEQCSAPVPPSAIAWLHFGCVPKWRTQSWLQQRFNSCHITSHCRMSPCNSAFCQPAVCRHSTPCHLWTQAHAGRCTLSMHVSVGPPPFPCPPPHTRTHSPAWFIRPLVGKALLLAQTGSGWLHRQSTTLSLPTLH